MTTHTFDIVVLGGGSGGYSSGVGLGVGTSFNLGGGPALTQTIEVIMGRGAPPASPSSTISRRSTPFTCPSPP